MKSSSKHQNLLEKIAGEIVKEVAQRGEEKAEVIDAPLYAAWLDAQVGLRLAKVAHLKNQRFPHLHQAPDGEAIAKAKAALDAFSNEERRTFQAHSDAKSRKRWGGARPNWQTLNKEIEAKLREIKQKQACENVR